MLLSRNRFKDTLRKVTSRNGSWMASGTKLTTWVMRRLAEVLVSQLLKQSNVSGFAEYEPVLIQYRGKEVPGCVSKSFRAKDEMLVPFERLHRAYKGRGLGSRPWRNDEDPQERIRYTVDFIEQTTGLTDVGAYLTLLLELDAFFLNEDRHTNNLAVIRN